MKLERILERLNSLEKGQFLKIINSLSAAEKNNPQLEAILSRADSNLKNADALQVTQAFTALTDRYVDFVMEDYSKVSSQLDILLNIITRDGNCIMRLDWFAKLYEEEIKKQKKAWKQNEVKISGTKASLITVVFHSSFGENENELFIGHAGVLVPTKDKKLLFVEKLSFSLPYQVLKFDNRKQLKNYLMGMYDTSWGQEEAKPFIMENTKTAL